MIQVRLSKLEASRSNPRRVKPEREAHRRLVASIRAHGLIEPLVVSAIEQNRYRVIAGNRRLAALRVVYRGTGEDPKIPCVVRVADGDAAAEVSLAENFQREPMHPLDEAEAFAKLASVECRGVKAIAAEFGVSEGYVRQRMLLAELADPIKAAFRRNEIGVGISEAFASVPAATQGNLWAEVGGKPRSAEQVRGLIENDWVPAEHALFDLGAIEHSAVSQDLFGGSVLIAREAFLKAQREALEADMTRLLEEGWSGAVVAARDALSEGLRRMARAEPEYDAPTTKRLEEIEARRSELQEAEIESDEQEEPIGTELGTLDEEEERVLSDAAPNYSEATKAKGTAFLILSADGSVERMFCIPRPSPTPHRHAGDMDAEAAPEATLPTCDELTDAQTAALRAQELLALREALVGDPLARKRLLVMALHDHVGRDAIMVRLHSSGADLLAATSPEFRSPIRPSGVATLAGWACPSGVESHTMSPRR